MLKHILIAHNLRGTADLALHRATQLAQQHGARLSVLHVLDPAGSEQAHDQARQVLDNSISHAVHQGGILRCLQEQLRARGSDLLVLGSHGRGALSQALLGILAQHFLHKAPCDVFVVR
ncbi:universal stress protein [Pseudomonas fulva]|uniref:universal stress protein n=1 Tax=Pseudomonas fulva TaxID=47880 RepID=UPI00201D6A1D|nr:universal stress protein [Pseudomonas fulva]UQY32527.1 universal stress protein [Pseudomonas fulva]